MVTAATNTMDVSAQRVADVFAYLGDASASGADEVGRAMQKASAAAQEFGVSFEWLGAYVATISEKTRQAPEVIGTSLNSIMARLHSIKEKGFNEEDATHINDIAKALATLKEPIKLIDEQTGEWRAMSDIFQEIAEQWDTLDAKQRAYISTTLAGTRQQNYFLALMTDMVKGAEGGSRAFELYKGAMNAAGTAAQKYSIWQESVTAAQNRLTTAMQSFYTLLDAEWMKGFYNTMAAMVQIITAGTDALGGWNLKLPLIIASVGALAAVIYKVIAAVKAMRTAMSAASGIMSVLSGGTVGAIMAGIAALASVITLITGSIAKAVEPVDYSEQIATLTTHRDDVATLAEEYKALASQQSVTKDEGRRMNEILERLAGSSLTLRDALTDSTGGFAEQGEAVKALNGYLLETETRLNNLKREQAADSFKDLSGIRVAQKALTKARDNENLWREYDQFKKSEMAAFTNFPAYVRSNILLFSDADHIQAQMYWAEIDDQLSGLVDGWIVHTSKIEEALDNLGLSAQEASANAADALNEAWQTVHDSLRVFVEGPKTSQMNPYFQDILADYFNKMIEGVDKEAEITSAKLTDLAAQLKAKQKELFELSSADTELKPLFDSYFKELDSISPNVESLNVLIDQINVLLEARNALIEAEVDQFPLLPNVDAKSVAQIKAASNEVAALSSSLSAFFTKQRQAREAEAAADNLYAEQIRGLKEAWTSDETGVAFSARLNQMYAANSELTEGLLETHNVLQDMAEGFLSYGDGLIALADMERFATKQAQEHTAELFKEAEATRSLEAARKDNYKALLAELQIAYNIGYDEYVAEWNRLSDEAKTDIIDLYPEVAKLATVMGETADGALAFADALTRAAGLKLNNFVEALSSGDTSRTKTEQAKAAKDNGYRGELAGLESALSTGGVGAMRQALFELYSTNDELYGGLMETYGVLYRLGNMDLTNAQAADVLSEAYRSQVAASAAKVQQMREQLAQEEKMARSEKGFYANSLKEMQTAYREGGAIGFHELWNTLDEDAQEYILKTYSAIGNLAAESIDRGVDVVDAIFKEAIAQAMAMKETLLKEELVEGAAGYKDKQHAKDAQKNGFQEQLTQLRDALDDGAFLDVLTGFGEEMTSALLSENEWLNAIIEGLSTAEDGTYDLTKATALLDEHIIGTQEQFLSNVKVMNEANAELLTAEEEQIAVLKSLMEALESGGVEAFRDAFNALGNEMQDAILDISPALQKFFKNLEKGADGSEEAINDLGREIDGLNLKKLQRDGKVWDELTEAMADASEGGKTFAKSYGTVIGKVEDLNAAMGALAGIQSGALTSADDLTDAYNILASYTGASAESLRNNLDPAIWAISADMNMASNSAAYLANWLWSTAGVSFSAANWQSQLAALAGSADATTANVARLVQTMLQCAGASLSLNGDTIQVNWGSGSYTPPSARSGGSSRSGGGGSNSSTSVTKSIQQMLDQMDAVQELEDHRRKMAQLAQGYHQTRGEIQGTILYLQKEMSIVAENNAALKGYLSTLEQQIAKKQTEIAKNKEGSKKYKQAMADLEALQAAHRQYSEELLQNITD